jgi:hypothetical protein
MFYCADLCRRKEAVYKFNERIMRCDTLILITFVPFSCYREINNLLLCYKFGPVPQTVGMNTTSEPGAAKSELPSLISLQNR